MISETESFSTSSNKRSLGRKPAVCFGLCDADGIVDRLLSAVSSAACVLLLFVYAVPEQVQDSILHWLRT